MLRHGSIRIRPLVYYTNEETLGNAVGDRNEGQRQSSMVIKNYCGGANATPNERQFLRELGFGNTQAQSIYMSEIVVSVTNYYAYCISDILSNDLLDDFLKDEPASVVTIADLSRFYSAVTSALGGYAIPHGFQKIVYVDKEYNYQTFGPINPAYVKQITYAHQSEIRMLWAAEGKLFEYIDIRSDEIAWLCAETDISNLA